MSKKQDQYEKVKAFVIESQIATIPNIQRKFKINYSRAATIMNQLELDGVVSEFYHDSGRRVLVKPESEKS